MSLTDEDKQWILAQLERVETKLLTGFHAAVIRGLDAEVESLADRVRGLEG